MGCVHLCVSYICVWMLTVSFPGENPMVPKHTDWRQTKPSTLLKGKVTVSCCQYTCLSTHVPKACLAPSSARCFLCDLCQGAFKLVLRAWPVFLWTSCSSPIWLVVLSYVARLCEDRDNIRYYSGRGLSVQYNTKAYDLKMILHIFGQHLKCMGVSVWKYMELNWCT